MTKHEFRNNQLPLFPLTLIKYIRFKRNKFSVHLRIHKERTRKKVTFPGEETFDLLTACSIGIVCVVSNPQPQQ